MWKFKHKYRVDEEHRAVIAFSSFAGKTITGVAKCDPEDTFDLDTGKKLASARCDFKVAKKRMKHAKACLEYATEAAEYWASYKEKMEAYVTDSAKAYDEALDELADIVKSFE
jgi:hypothetical protein